MIPYTLKTILVDVDGVLANFYPAMLMVLRNNIEKNYPYEKILLNMIPKYDDIREYWIENRLKQEHVSAIKKELTKSSFWRNLPEIEDAIWGVNKLKEMGYDILFVSTPTIECRDWERVRLEWLQNKFEWVTKKHLLPVFSKEYVDGDMMIDDYQGNVSKWLKMRKYRGRKNPIGIVFKAPYNRDLGSKQMTWADIIDSLES